MAVGDGQNPSDLVAWEDTVKILTKAVEDAMPAPAEYDGDDYISDEFTPENVYPMCTKCVAVSWPEKYGTQCEQSSYFDCLGDANDGKCELADDFDCWNEELNIDIDTLPEPYVPEPASCQCFANGAENESFCETGAMLYDVAGCVSDTRCHWGPGEIEECGMMNSIFTS